LSVNSQAGKARNSQTWEVTKLVIMEWFQQKCFFIYQLYFSKDVTCQKMFYVQECVKITEEVRLKTQLMAKMQNL
jgi:hypothetical protein